MPLNMLETLRCPGPLRHSLSRGVVVRSIVTANLHIDKREREREREMRIESGEVKREKLGFTERKNTHSHKYIHTYIHIYLHTYMYIIYTSPSSRDCTGWSDDAEARARLGCSHGRWKEPTRAPA